MAKMLVTHVCHSVYTDELSAGDIVTHHQEKRMVFTKKNGSRWVQYMGKLYPLNDKNEYHTVIRQVPFDNFLARINKTN